ncbi:MAG: 50S ribosomal protein L19, partial [Clostridia bacterium]|nr:50S ribosomal protein L19 [Clostridia bacterium]
MDALKLMAADSMKETTPSFAIGDTIRVEVRIREGERERL